MELLDSSISLSLSLSTNDRRTNDYLSLQAPTRSFPTEWNGISLQRFDPRGNPRVWLCRRRRYYPPPRGGTRVWSSRETSFKGEELRRELWYAYSMNPRIIAYAVSARVSRASWHSSPLCFELSRVLLLRVHTCREEGKTTTDRARGDNARSESRLHSDALAR